MSRSLTEDCSRQTMEDDAKIHRRFSFREERASRRDHGKLLVQASLYS